MPFSTISSWVLLLAKSLDANGIDSATLLSNAGMDIGKLSRAGARVPVSVLQQSWRLTERTTDDPAFGLELAAHWHPTSLHALGYSWMASTTLREAIERAQRYSRVVSDLASLGLQQRWADRAWFVVTARVDPVSDLQIDAGLAVMLRMCRELAGESLVPLQVAMTRSPPPDPEPYQRYFGATIEYGQQRNGLLLPAVLLDQPLPTANPALVRANDQVMVDYLAGLDRSDLTHRAQAEVVAQLPTGRIEQDDIARSLNMSRRTLQRRLAAEGTSFREILETVRREMARSYVADRRYRISEVAFMLGYADTTNFTKAFRRWFGLPPLQWRARQSQSRKAG